MVKKSFKEVSGFNDRWIMLLGLPLASIMITLILFNKQYEQGNWRSLLVCLPISFLYSIVFWASLRWTYKCFKIRYPHDINTRLFGLAIVFVGLFFVVDITLDNLLRLVLTNTGNKPSEVLEFVTSFIMCALVVMIYEALSFHIQLQRAVTEKTELERQNVESQLEGLRNQVNPHFLFNSLNTLVYLIPEDPDKAVRFVQQLSKVYRYVLESREAKMIPLKDELEFLHAYIFLLKERFGENLQIKLHDLNGASDGAIVPLTLQMLFENAIKHNVISAGKPLSVEMFAENGHLVVRNNLQRKNQVMDSTGIGLDNIRTRYRMLTDREVQVIASRDYFTVLLPLVDIVPDSV